MELQEAFDAGFVAVKAYVDREIGTLGARLAALETRAAPERGEKGEPGDPGPAGPAGRDGVDGAAGAVGEPGPQGIAGDPGPQGVAGGFGPAGADGAAGAQGLQGEPGAAGQDGQPGAAGRDGVDGKDGSPGRDGEDGQLGQKGDPGPAGIGAAGAVIDREGNLMLTMSDGSTSKLGLVVGQDGRAGEKGVDGVDGKDGADGFGFDDMSVYYDGERDMRLVFGKGEDLKEFLIPLSHPLDRGVWKAGDTYQKGDGATFDGSWWIAQKETGAQPGASADWRMAVRKGRNGRDGIVKTLPAPGPVKVGG